MNPNARRVVWSLWFLASTVGVVDVVAELLMGRRDPMTWILLASFGVGVMASVALRKAVSSAG